MVDRIHSCPLQKKKMRIVRCLKLQNANGNETKKKVRQWNDTTT